MITYIKVMHKTLGIGLVDTKFYNIKNKTKIEFAGNVIKTFNHQVVSKDIEVLETCKQKEFSYERFGRDVKKETVSRNIRNAKDLTAYVSKIWKECTNLPFPRHVEVLKTKNMSKCRACVEWKTKNKRIQSVKLKVSDKIINKKGFENTIRHELAHLYVLVVLDNKKEGHGRLWKKTVVNIFKGSDKVRSSLADVGGEIHAVVCSKCGALRSYNFIKTETLKKLESLSDKNNPTESSCCKNPLKYIGKVEYKKKYIKGVDFK